MKSRHTDLVQGESQCARLLSLLKDKKWHDTKEIMRRVYGVAHSGICRIAGRAWELKQRGYDIESKKLKSTVWAYRLI